MPYTNVPDDKQDKMHRCVLKVKDSGKDEQAAIAICYASIVEGQAAPDELKDIMGEFTLTTSADMLVDMQSQTAQPGKPFDGMRAGSFVDMYGRSVTFDGKELAEYVANTKAAIAATRSESGEIVGLPIDAQNHNKGDAAGWIIDASLAGDVVRLTPRWTDLGLDLIGSSRQRFFSPTVDMSNKTIVGGSLTNWPATRAKGKTLLRPIELAEGDPKPMEEALAKIMEMLGAIWEKIKGETEETPAAPAADMAQTALAAELAQAKQTIADLTAQNERKNKIAEFAQRVTAGTKDNPRGLNMPASQLSEVLLSLPDETAQKVQAMLESLVVVEFGERGHAGQIQQKQEVPALIAPYLREWVKAGKPVESFFSINPEVGKMEDFNLSQFQEK